MEGRGIVMTTRAGGLSNVVVDGPVVPNAGGVHTRDVRGCDRPENGVY